jgi:hypothetical protein
MRRERILYSLWGPLSPWSSAQVRVILKSTAAGYQCDLHRAVNTWHFHCDLLQQHIVTASALKHNCTRSLSLYRRVDSLCDSLSYAQISLRCESEVPILLHRFPLFFILSLFLPIVSSILKTKACATKTIWTMKVVTLMKKLFVVDITPTKYLNSINININLHICREWEEAFFDER